MLMVTKKSPYSQSQIEVQDDSYVHMNFMSDMLVTFWFRLCHWVFFFKITYTIKKVPKMNVTKFKLFTYSHPWCFRCVVLLIIMMMNNENIYVALNPLIVHGAVH